MALKIEVPGYWRSRNGKWYFVEGYVRTTPKRKSMDGIKRRVPLDAHR